MVGRLSVDIFSSDANRIYRQVSVGLNVVRSVLLAIVLANYGAAFWAVLTVGYAWSMMVLILRQGRVEFAAVDVKVKLTPSLVRQGLIHDRGGCFDLR